MSDFNSQVLNEANLNSLIEQQIKSPSNKELNQLVLEKVTGTIRQYLSVIKILKIIPQELDARLNKDFNRNLISLFFKVQSVTDNTEIKRVEEKLDLIGRSIKPKKLSASDVTKRFDLASLYLRSIPHEFEGIPDSHIERKQTGQLVDWVHAPIKAEEKGVVLLVGNAGYGKTVILRDVYSVLKSQGVPVLGIKADKIYASTLTELETKLGFEIEESVAVLKEDHDKIAFVIDQIDALSQSLSARRDYLDTYNFFIESLLQIDGVRVILSVRSYDLNYDNDLRFYKNQKSFEVGLLEVEKVKSILEAKISKLDIHSELLELLRVPHHLNVFCKVWNSSLGLDKIRTLHDLYNELWRQNISSSSNPKEYKSLVYKIAQKMHEQQRISLALNQILDAPQANLDYLSSNHLIVIESNQLQFFHQTFFDYCFAKQFVESGRSVKEYLLANHQGLFVRASIKMVLTFLRDHNPQAYIKLIKDILYQKKFRFHLKLLLLNELGFRTDPKNSEKILSLKLIRRNTELGQLFIESVYSKLWLKFLIDEKVLHNILSKGYFQDAIIERLTGKGKIPMVLKKVSFIRSIETNRIDDINQVFILFRKLLPSERELIIPFLESCPEFTGKSMFVFRLLYFIKIWDHPGTIRLFEKYQDEAKNDTFALYKILEDASKDQIDWVIKIYNRIVAKKLEHIEKSTEKPEFSHDDLELFKKLYEADRQKALKFNFDVIKRISEATLISVTEDKLKDDFAFWLFDYDRNNHLHNHDGVYSLLIEQTRRLAKEYVDEFRALYDTESDSTSITVLKALVFGLKENAVELGGEIVDFLVHFEKNGGLNHDNKIQYYIRELIEVAYPQLNPSNQQIIDDLILRISPSYELQMSQGQNGKKIHYLRFYGTTKYKFLNRVPKEILLTKKKLRDEFLRLERKFGEQKDREPNRFSMYAVPPPLPSNAYKKMKVEDWEKSFQMYTNEFPSKYGSLGGSILEHSRSFKDEVARRPSEFADFIERLIDENKVPQDYIIKGIEGLVQGKYDIRELLSLFKKAILMDKDREYTRDLVWATNYFLKEGEVDQEIAEFLCESAVSHKDPSTDRDVDDYLQHGINTVRGAAANKVLYLYQFPKYKDLMFKTLIKVTNDPVLSVQCSVMPELAYLMNLDKKMTLKLFYRLIESGHEGIMKLTPRTAQYLANHFFAEMEPYFKQALKYETLHGDISTILTTLKIRDNLQYGSLHERLLKKSEVARSKVIDVAAYFLVDEKKDVRARAIKYFLRYKDQTTEKVVQEYSSVFLHFEETNFTNLLHVLKKVSKSKAVSKSPQYFFDYLLKSAKRHPRECIDLLGHFDQYEKPDLSKSGHYDDEPVKVLIGAYNSLRQVHDPDQVYMEKSMSLFDRMLKDERFRGFAHKVAEIVDK